MVDIAQTPADVGFGEHDVRIEKVKVSEAVTQGQPAVGPDGNEEYAQAHASAAAGATLADAVGVFISPAGAGGSAIVQFDGKIKLGATLVIGQTYVVSHNKGKIMAIDQLVSTDYVTHLGIADSTSTIDLKPAASGAQKP